MHYIEETLSQNEKVVKLFNLNWINYVKGYLFLLIAIPLAITILYYTKLLTLSIDGVMNLLLTLVPIFVLVIPFFLWLKSFEQGVTNRRVVLKSGIVSRDTTEIRLEAIEKIEIKQTVLGRIFNFGTVHVTGKGTASLIIKDIDDPIEIKRAIESAVELREQDFIKTI
jgi:membrane protein YdbS with pleckstrin-like domain